MLLVYFDYAVSTYFIVGTHEALKRHDNRSLHANWQPTGHIANPDFPMCVSGTLAHEDLFRLAPRLP